MRTIGMIGGMSWESSAIYYRMVNEAVKERLGGHHSAETVMYSVDFAPIKRLQHEGRWEETAASLAQAARKVEQGGADFVVLSTNTIPRMAGAITETVILGCTEITMLVGQEDASVPLFDTTRIHAEKAVEMALDARDLGAGGRQVIV
jgi:aspartate racemase